MEKGCLLGQFFFVAVVICRVVLKSVLAMFLRQLCAFIYLFIDFIDYL